MNSILYDLFMAAIGALIGTVLTLVISRIKENKFKLLWYVQNEDIVINAASRFTDLTIAYKGRVVNSFSVVTLVLWNHGRKTVNKSDFAIMPKIKFLNNNDVYFCGIIDSSNKQSGANNFKIQCDLINNAISIEFDYIAKNQGVVIQIMYDGTEEGRLELSSEIKEGEQIPKKPLTGNINWTDPLMTIYQAIAFGTAMVLALVMEMIVTPWLIGRGLEQLEHSEIFAIIFGFAIVLAGFIYTKDKRWRIPKAFRRYFDNRLIL